jgi:hypothetical protein
MVTRVARLASTTAIAAQHPAGHVAVIFCHLWGAEVQVVVLRLSVGAAQTGFPACAASRVAAQPDPPSSFTD